LAHGSVGEGEASLEHLAIEAGVPIVQIPALGRRVSPLSDLRALAALLAITFREAPDVIHTHTAKAGALGRVAALIFNVTRPRRRRCVVIHTFHGHVLEGYFHPVVSRIVRETERFLAHMTDRIVAISPSQREDLVERFGIGDRDSTVVVPLGLDLAPLVADTRARSLRNELGVEERSIVFGFVGRLVSIKDVPALILAFAGVVPHIPGATLLIVGDGPERANVERAIRERGLADRVRLLGWREDLTRIYATMDVCVLSSRNEGTPVAVIEAMAAGRPVVATRVGGVADVVVHGETGTLVSQGNVNALSEAMVELAKDPALRARMGSRGRQLAVSRFGHDRLVDEIDRLYAAALAQKRAWPGQRAEIDHIA
jgi:glycosyltransferase involved in cell wall biosynthesis